MTNKPEEIDARIQAAVDKGLREAGIAKPVQPEPARRSTMRWPELGPLFSAALDRATDEYEANGNLGAAVSRIYAAAHREPALANEMAGWRNDPNSPLAGWTVNGTIEAGLIGNLIESRHRVRESKRGKVFSALPDSVTGAAPMSRRSR